MTPELYWTILTALFTSVLWAPHIIMRIIEMKPYLAFRDPFHDVSTRAPWAQRAIRAHSNAVENLIIFAVFAFAIQILSVGTALSALAASVYFFSRVIHYIVYILGIPWLRTPVYLTGFFCQMVLAATLFGWL